MHFGPSRGSNAARITLVTGWLGGVFALLELFMFVRTRQNNCLFLSHRAVSPWWLQLSVPAPSSQGTHTGVKSILLKNVCCR